MNADRWQRTCSYIHEVFGVEDDHLASVMPRAIEAGLPDIAVSAEVGRLLQLLVSLTNNGAGARLALELGTLAGYSAIWIARGLAHDGRLITIEAEPKHAAFASRELATAGVAEQVDVRTHRALDLLPSLRRELGEQSLDFAFIDAVKTEYPEYLQLVAPMMKRGGLLVADNALGSNYWIVDQHGDPARDAVDRFNRLLAADHAFVAACVPLRQGLAIARRV